MTLDASPFRLSMIVAVARGGTIGSNNGLPWRYPEDLKRFRALTTGHAVIMGRATYESIGRPLPNRTNIVLSRKEFRVLGIMNCTSVDEALSRAASIDHAPFVIGGAQIYAAFLPFASAIHVTKIDADFVGDAFFPELSADRWVVVDSQPAETSGLTFVTYGLRAPFTPATIPSSLATHR